MPTTPTFTTVMRGYDREQVETLVQQGTEALESSSETIRASARAALQEPTLTISLRGYDRGQVDTYLAELSDRLT